MPKIDIREIDLTQSSGTIGTDIPFIPGLANQAQIVNVDGTITSLYGTPVLCTSIRQFEQYFGKCPKKINSDCTKYDIKKDEYDRSYIMAKELLNAGMPIYYYAVNVDNKPEGRPANDIDYFMEEVTTYFKDADLEDVGEYSIKFITSGGYPNYGKKNPLSGVDGMAAKMISIAANRGDCVAIIEEALNNTLTGAGSFIDSVKLLSADGDEFATAFTPWAYYSLKAVYKDANGAAIKMPETLMPACFGYLIDLATNIRTSPNWLAIAGTTRGLVPNIVKLAPTTRLSNRIADDLQPREGDGSTTRAINAITDIKPYGLCIWGNRTLKAIDEELIATNFLNTRNMISDIKKVAYRAAKEQMFEQNSEVLWLNFKAKVSPFLEQLKSGNGISNYKLIKLDTKFDGSKLRKEEFACAIKIYPMYAVEAFEINVVILDNDVTVG